MPIPLTTRWRLKLIQAMDRHRLRRRCDQNPGLTLAADVSTNLASSHFDLAPGSQLTIGERVYTERREYGVHISVAEGAHVEIGADTWLRSDIAPVIIFAFPGAHIRIGREGFLNGCHLSAKSELDIGNRVWIGPGTRVFDADQHDLDSERGEQIERVVIGDHCWVAADVTILRGVEIGEQSVVGARALVTRSMPPHTLALGSPAKPAGKIGDRSQVPI
jgi:acetyltransferase-like isoleucine patch superfamily enzyme